MNNYTLDKRCMDILKMLLYANGYVSIAGITEHLGISKRSAYYDLEKIDDWLRDNGLSELERDRRQGIRISGDTAEELQTRLFAPTGRSYRTLSPIERERLILCILFLYEKPLYVEDIMNYCDVSRNTTVSDLKSIADFLKKNKLNLQYLIKRGYSIQGDPVRKRALFFLYYPQFIDYFNQMLYTDAQKELINENQLRLKQIEHDLHSEYVSGMIPTLAAFISSIEHGGPSSEDILEYKDLDTRDILDTQEYRLVCWYFGRLSGDEQIYIALHLLGSRMQTEPVLLKRGEKTAQEIAAKLVKSFEEISGIRYGDQKEILRALTSHLRTSLYRYRYGIQLGNPMLESIRTEYKELFELTKAAFLRISDEINLRVSDAEIAYLTLHFGAFMSPEEELNRPFRILIVCPNGIGTSNMIKSEVKRLVPQATEVRNIPLSKYNPDHNYDAVISTVPIKKEKKLIVVDPILTDQDRVAILRRCINTEPSARIQIDAIMQIARKYISGDRIADFERDIAELYSAMKVHETPKADYGDGLLHYLQPSHVQISSQPIPYKEALVYSLRPLLLEDSVTQDYVDAIIEEQLERQHYMFLTDGLVLAHSKSENGVKKVDAAMTIFREPVTWGNGKLVYVVIALSAVDQTHHIRILNDILDIFSKKKRLEQLSALGSYAEVCKFLQK